MNARARAIERLNILAEITTAARCCQLANEALLENMEELASEPKHGHALGVLAQYRVESDEIVRSSALMLAALEKYRELCLSGE